MTAKLDTTAFHEWWELLELRFNRQTDLTAPAGQRMLGLYFEHVKHMTTEQFQAAARKVFNEDQFFPSPQRLAEALTAVSADELELMWTDFFTRARRSGKPGLQHLPAHLFAINKHHDFWFRLCEASNDTQRASIRREFLAVARQLAGKGELVHAG